MPALGKIAHDLQDAALLRFHFGHAHRPACVEVFGEQFCRAQAGSGEVDAGIDTRWQRVAAALGKVSTW